ncbi:MAG: hypothetical protein ABII26_07020 [Pseudomonadota bacterium]
MSLKPLEREEARRQKARLVDALAQIGLKNGDRVSTNAQNDGTFSIQL